MSLMALCTVFGKSHKMPLAIPAPESTGDSNIVAQFEDPIWSNGGADPWIWQQSGIYYFTYTQGAKVVLYKTGDITHLGNVISSATGYATVYTPPSTLKDIWAPELHRINNKWYMYFAADDGDNKNHRMYVIENPAVDPTTGRWTLKGKVSDATDIRIYNTSGQLIKAQALRPGLNMVDIRQLSTGVYFCDVNGVKEKLIKR